MYTITRFENFPSDDDIAGVVVEFQNKDELTLRATIPVEISQNFSDEELLDLAFSVLKPHFEAPPKAEVVDTKHEFVGLEYVPKVDS